MDENGIIIEFENFRVVDFNELLLRLRKNNIHDIRLGYIMNEKNVNINPHIDCFQTWVGTYYELAQNILFTQNYCENLNQGMYVFMLEGGANHLYIVNNVFRAYGGINTGGGADYLYVLNNLWANSLDYFEV